MQTRSKSYICPNDTLVGHSCGTLLWDTLCSKLANCGSHKTLRLRSEIILHTSTSYIPIRFLAISHESDTSRFHPKPSPKASPNGSALALYCERLRAVANGCEHRNNGPRTRLYPQTPRAKREPFATHREKIIFVDLGQKDDEHENAYRVIYYFRTVEFFLNCKTSLKAWA